MIHLHIVEQKIARGHFFGIMTGGKRYLYRTSTCVRRKYMGAKPAFFSAREIAEIVDKRFAALVLYARSWNVDAAEDLVQDALLKLVEQPKRPANPTAWLCKIIRNAAVNRYRQAERQRKHETEAARQKPEWFVPRDSLSEKESAEQAAQKLVELSVDAREIVVLRIWDQLTFDEIADLIGMPKTAVFRMYTEALQELRRKLS